MQADSSHAFKIFKFKLSLKARIRNRSDVSYGKQGRDLFGCHLKFSQTGYILGRRGRESSEVISAFTPPFLLLQVK